MPAFQNTLSHLHRQVDSSRILDSTRIYLPMKMEQTECSKTSTYKLQTPGNYPKESMQHTEHGESSKSSIKLFARMCWRRWLVRLCSRLQTLASCILQRRLQCILAVNYIVMEIVSRLFTCL